MTRAILLFKRKLIFIILPLFFVLIPFTYTFAYSNKILPGISIAGVDLGNSGLESAVSSLTQNIKVPEKIKLTSGDNSFEINTKEIELSYDYIGSVNRAYGYTRTGNIIYDFIESIKLLFYPVDFGLATKFNEEKLDRFISVISGQVSTDSTPASIVLKNDQILINKGKEGISVDNLLLRISIGNQLAYANSQEIKIPTFSVNPPLSDAQAQELQKRAESYIGKSIQIKFESQPGSLETFDYPTSALLKIIKPQGGLKEEEIAKIVFEIAKKINRDPQNPKFNFDGNKVLEFAPALEGIKLKEDQFRDDFTNLLKKVEISTDKNFSLDVAVIRTSPDVSTDKVNNLGIKELIGRGTSTYFHSIPGRVHNVSLAASRINGILVKPGDTFSFNNSLGDVSQFTGYQQAYIISEGKTILGDGGGVCQVSSTLFRALLSAGLPITERTAHAYRVGYYEQNSPPGMDATVYGPSPDLKFKNDTDNYILIEAKADPKHYSLVFELYGTKDGRISEITKPIVTNVTQAPEDRYQDDPTLPLGTIKQVDFKANGAKVSFNYKVTKNGQIIFKKTFTSNYRPWQAVYLRGTGTGI